MIGACAGARVPGGIAVMDEALLSSTKMDWETPETVLDLVRQIGPIGVDVCSTVENPTGARRYFTPAECGRIAMQESWPGHDRGDVIWMNPPYGRELRGWLRDFARAAADWSGAHWLALTPARPDTRWFVDTWRNASALCLWTGRMTFKGAPAPAPFPSAVWYWGGDPHRSARCFASAGS